ncbi:hypothetical protein D1871_02920 [Nakamurella silvestris]|nr:hypothetical protein D1871_02920 [Nakamurella silvestris]
MSGVHRPGVVRAERVTGVSALTGLDQAELSQGEATDRALTDEALWREIAHNRRAELRLVPEALLALLVVAGLIILREVYFR